MHNPRMIDPEYEISRKIKSMCRLTVRGVWLGGEPRGSADLVH
jgi:hypothetical protein